MRKKIGILGGTFDPPHLGHLLIANEVLTQLELDEVKFMPNKMPPHKEDLSDENDRLQMVQLAIADHPLFSIEDIELHREGLSYTYDTMLILTKRYPDNDYYFIIGADMVEYLPQWYKIDELVKLVRFVGTARPNFEVDTNYPVELVDVPQVDISSSMIRERVKAGRSIKYLLPDPVIQYIEENQLYGS